MEDTEPSAAKMRFCRREVAYGFVPSGTAYPHSRTRPNTHLESLAGMACSLCPLKHGTMAVGWHSLPGSRAGPFSATAHLGRACETLHTSSVSTENTVRFELETKLAPTTVTQKGDELVPSPAQAAPPPLQDIGEKSRASQPCARQT